MTPGQRDMLWVGLGAASVIAVVSLLTLTIAAIVGPNPEYRCLVFNHPDREIATEYRCTVSANKGGTRVRAVAP